MKKKWMVPVVLLKTRTGYNAFSPAIEGCVATDRTMEKTLERMREALEFHLEGERLVKQLKGTKSIRLLKDTFDDYGTDALYASLNVAA